MDKRLTEIYKMLPKEGKGIIDVGTDHGCIPIQLVKDRYPGTVYASDIVSGPLNTAIKSAQREHVDQRIHFLLCDGLALCPPDRIDCILIAGMGGDTICRILDDAEWLFSDSYTLILQPMTHAEVLRYWLQNNEYSIVSEALAFENSQAYQIFCAVPGVQKAMADFEYYIGSTSLPREGGDLKILALREAERMALKVDGLRKASRRSEHRLHFYESIKNQLEEYYNTI